MSADKSVSAAALVAIYYFATFFFNYHETALGFKPLRMTQLQ